MISDFKAGTKVCQAVLLRVQKIGNSSNGGVFARGLLEDNSGKMILENIFSGALYDKFLINPAGMRLHHAYIGGLLQHSVDVAGIAQSLGERIGGVDKDLIVAGALLHDVGKLREISSDIGFPYTMEGRLLGHVAMSAVMVQEASAKVKVTGPKLQQLLHIILSHHGEQEKGSPVACATKESFIVHYADEIDAIMNQFGKNEGKNPWEYNKMLQRFLLHET